MVAARQASAAREAMRYMTNHQLGDIGFTCDNQIEGIKALISVELDAKGTKAILETPVDINRQAAA